MRCEELAGQVDSGEFAALCKNTDEIEVVSRAEYLNDRTKVAGISGARQSQYFCHAPEEVACGVGLRLGPSVPRVNTVRSVFRPSTRSPL
jgi:hypothetical protein